MDYKKLNNITGWAVFGLAMLVYLLTMSPTASFWDCGEFIACSNELEVPHPPGAPFFLLVGRIFAILAFGDVTKIALMLNVQSVLSASFTVLFTFWITTTLAKKILVGIEEKISQEKTLAIMAAGVVAALACTFADSFWFNAVEAEVYAMSSFFTAIVVWLMLKWEERADEPGNERWIILIAYLMGLSIGVHLLNLLTIPALAFIYYFRKYNFSWAGFFATGAVSVAILGLIQTGIILWTFDMAWAFETVFVGTQSASGATTSGMGLPLGTGVVISLLVLTAGLTALTIYSIRTKNLLLNTFALSVIVVYIGFSSYTMIPLRSKANPPIDENNPENTQTFLSYMKREQYGNRPLLYGPLYNETPYDYDREREYILEEGKDRYTEGGYKLSPKYRNNKLFPRMYEPGRYNMGPHAYTAYVKNTGQANTPYDDKPTNAEDLRYFIGYQVVHMYWRYFMWNFSGRENDVQDCSWESGLAFWKTAKMPETVRNNPAKNHFYMIPFFLGLLGLGWQIYKRPFDASIVGLLFFFTGFAIILYLNQYPMQPRERDYSFAGSFQTYAIWIGLGVIGLYELLKRYLGKSALYTAAAIGLLAPALMAAEGWNDHSRAGRYVAPDSAYNLLNSCAPNAILFTNGDNDTFPLWYIQEVENVRTDVRVLCLSYVNTDWYIEQMYRQANESAPLPLTLKRSEFVGQENQATYLREDQAQVNLRLPVNAQELVAKGILTQEEAAMVQGNRADWTVNTRAGGNRRYLELKDRVIINLVQNVANNGWDRPVYFANTVAPNSFIGLQDNLRLEGLAYRVLPVKYPRIQDRYDPYQGSVDANRMYENLVEKSRYRNLDNPGVYFDENINRMVSNYHGVIYRLANHYLREAERLESASANDTLAIPQEIGEVKPEDLRARGREVMTFLDEKIPYTVAEPEPYVIIRDGIMFDRLGMTEKATQYFEDGSRMATETLSYYAESGGYFAKVDTYLLALRMLAQHYGEKGDSEKFQALMGQAQNLEQRLRAAQR